MILGTSRAVRVFAYPEPVDLREGYDGPFGLVKMGLGRDPLSGDLFLFVGKRRTGCRVLIWDGTGCASFRTRLLQLLDDGRLTDGQGRTVDFKNTSSS